MPPRMLFLLFAISLTAAAEPRYFGLEVPQDRPEPFRPHIFESLGALTPTNPAYSPDFRRFAFTTVDQRTPGKALLAIFESRFDGKRWSEPRRVNLDSDGFNDAEPAFSPDGRWLYFNSNRPANVPWSIKLFRARIDADEYRAVEPVPLDFHPRRGIYYPQLRAEGTLTFTSSETCEGCSDDLYIAGTKADGSFATPERLDGDFNSQRDDWDLTEDPSGRLRLWASAREGGAGRVDVYFSRRDAKGVWSPARNLAAINSPAIETAPRLTPDGKVLFFQRIENGREQIYWLSSRSLLED